MNDKLVSQLNDEGYFVGSAIADESPREPGKYMLPAGCVDIEPPTIPDGMVAKFNGSGFTFEPAPTPPAPPAPEEPASKALRAAAYQQEADPLFFKSQRGEATQEEWLAKVDEIKARYPDPVS